MVTEYKMRSIDVAFEKNIYPFLADNYPRKESVMIENFVKESETAMITNQVT